MGYVLSSCCFCNCGNCEGCLCVQDGQDFRMPIGGDLGAVYCNQCGSWDTILKWTEPRFPGDGCCFIGQIALVNALTEKLDESGCNCDGGDSGHPDLYGPIQIMNCCGAADAQGVCQFSAIPCTAQQLNVTWLPVAVQYDSGAQFCSCDPIIFQAAFAPSGGASPDECLNQTQVLIWSQSQLVGGGPGPNWAFWMSQCDANGQNCTWQPVTNCNCNGTPIPPGTPPTGPSQVTFTPC